MEPSSSWSKGRSKHVTQLTQDVLVNNARDHHSCPLHSVMLAIVSFHADGKLFLSERSFSAFALSQRPIDFCILFAILSQPRHALGPAPCSLVSTIGSC
jgi:hypothetical protein